MEIGIHVRRERSMIVRGTAVTLAALLLWACVPDADDDARRSSRGTATGAAGPRADSVLDARAADATPADTAGTGDSEAAFDASSDTAWVAGRVEVDRETREVAVQTDLRVAEHDRYDRIVIDFGDDALPGYRIGYIDSPVTACGSGEAVELPGDAFLSIRLYPAAAHDDTGNATVQNRDVFAGLPAVNDVRAICDFEGVVEWVAATNAPNEFRVLELSAPNRIVVDVRH